MARLVPPGKALSTVWLCGLMALIFVPPAALAQAGSAGTVNTARLQTEYRTAADILNLLDQIKPDPQRVASYRAVLNKPLPPDDAFWFTKRDALLARMDAAETLGDVKTLVASADSIMAIFRERKDRLREMEYGMSYAGILSSAGRDKEARDVEEEVAKDPKTYSHWLMTYHNRSVYRLATSGNVEAALPHYSAAAAEYRRLNNYAALPNTASGYYRTTASLLRAQGKFAEAEANYLLALKETRRWVDNMSSVAGAARHALPSTQGYGAYLGYRIEYSGMLLDIGRIDDAEKVAREPLLWSLERMGKYSPHAVRAAAAYANVLGSQGRHIEAERLAQASIEMAQGIGAAPESSFMRTAHISMARALLGQGRIAQANATYALVPLAADALLDTSRAIVAIQSGQAAQVVGILKQQADRAVANVGAANPIAGEAVGVYAMALAAAATDTSAQALALATFRAAMPAILAARKQSGVAEEAMRVKYREWILQSYLSLLGQSAATDAQSLADSFVVADLLRSSGTQLAVAASAARAAVTDPALAATVRKEQDLRTALVNQFRALQRLAILTPEQLKESGENPAALKGRIDATVLEHGGLFAEIERRFPEYANLIDPQPPSVAQVRSALKPGEVMISILTVPERSFVWAVPSYGNAAFHSSPLGEREIATIVKRLRAALDVGPLPPGQWPVLDVAASHRLYSELLLPLDSTFAGAHTLIVAANGSLASLPPSIFVTAPHLVGTDTALLFDRYTAVPWLDKQFALAQVPSVNAFVSLRNARSVPATRLFTGFGDPVFSSGTSLAAAGSQRNALRSSVTTRPDAQSLRNNHATAWLPYSSLAPLPDTREEVIAIAKALGADPVRDVVLGRDVTRQRVMKSDLSSSRILVFATHGLIAGDFPGVNQPALALSAPAGKDADKEPLEALLTLEDVLQLKLNADWVVLSACNTAAADGLGGEAVSGLGRAFFYAGSKALLVTHWSVDSASARDLVSHTFGNYANNPSLTRAKALQLAMHEVRGGASKDASGKATYSLAHPLFWAPYALIGEPGR